MKELQEDIGAWQTDTFKQANIPSLIRHLEREVKELEDAAIAHAVLSKRGLPGAIKAEHELKSELADIVILAVAIADLVPIDLNQAVKDKMVINKARKWKAPDADGVVEHVR